MVKATKLERVALDDWLRVNPEWKESGGALERTYAFQHYSAGVAFAVQIAMAADKRDHHPELHLTWGKVAVRWTTHDARGITALDLEMALLCDRAVQSPPERP